MIPQIRVQTLPKWPKWLRYLRIDKTKRLMLCRDWSWPGTCPRAPGGPQRCWCRWCCRAAPHTGSAHTQRRVRKAAKDKKTGQRMPRNAKIKGTASQYWNTPWWPPATYCIVKIRAILHAAGGHPGSTYMWLPAKWQKILQLTTVLRIRDVYPGSRTRIFASHIPDPHRRI